MLGVTAIPRWTLDPAPGVAEHEAAVPDGVIADLRGLAVELGVPLSAVLLGAHARVLAVLTGEPVVTTGCVAPEAGEPLPCRLTTDQGSWRGLLLEAARGESELDDHRSFPFETVFDPAGEAPGLSDDAVLEVKVLRSSDGLGLRLRYRTDVLDADAAARIAGYHLTALALIAADPDADPGRQSLLGNAELGFQLEGLAGPHRELPDRRFHELFEARVREHPEAVAAIQGERHWTYAELNARANRLGRALLARGLGQEGVVAVVTERNLDWMAAVLAIFKAGGVYLPIEPQFPADRIAATLNRAGCTLVLTEPGSTATLDRALESTNGVQALAIHAVYEEDHADHDLGVAVEDGQLAYIYFTSGSTGEPKGAMCEQAGFLNHLYAKIDDLEIGAGDVVAQTAPQCFDISLWQLVSALLVGGRTLLVGQDAILDVERFVDKVVDGRVAVLQVVPSYLDAVLSHLDQRPRELPDLRCVSVTGEAATKELARRWFTAQPGIKLVNAYGLTETSDDTNHEVMHRAPEGRTVPLGRPVNNVRVHVVDEHLAPVPLGAPGEIAFSGVCVGRGYVNDPERTRLAYLPDPHREGERLYRSGDFGRWRPDGTLEFIGRRDAQVKVSGFRIEIGEIQEALMRVPGVRQGAAVVAGHGDQSRQLVAFYSSNAPLDDRELRGRLGESLPGYMIPTAFHRRDALPLTANGKVDRGRLTALAGELDGTDGDLEPPDTPSERRLADAWATVLGIPADRIGRRDDFFDRGGTSLAALKLVVELDRAVTLRQVTEKPVLADLAALLGDGAERRSELRAVAEPAGIDAVSPGTPPIVRVDRPVDVPGWAAENRDDLREIVAEHGSVLVRGLALRDAGEVGAVFRRLAGRLMTEAEAFASRRAYSNGVYSSSTWPATQPMCMHHELSYALEFPGLLLFACLDAPGEGGATAVAGSTAVLEDLPVDLVERFERDGWLLTRNYNDEIGASIGEAFGTDERDAVERYCRANAIDFEWQPDGGLRTSQRRSAVVRHPVTGRRCWFNQVAFLSEWTMDPEVREYLFDLYGQDGLPFNTSFGNGEEIGQDVVQLVNSVYDANTMREPWQTGDLMLVDNLGTAHSREPFEGPREVLVGLADPVRAEGCAPTIEVAAA